MAILFLGLGSLWLEVKTSPSTSAANTTRAINDVGSGLAPGESITITHNGTTTTTTTTTAPPTTVQSPAQPAPPTSLAPTSDDRPDPPTDTAPSTTTGPHHQPYDIEFGPRSPITAPLPRRSRPPDEYLVARVDGPPGLIPRLPRVTPRHGVLGGPVGRLPVVFDPCRTESQLPPAVRPGPVAGGGLRSAYRVALARRCDRRGEVTMSFDQFSDPDEPGSVGRKS